MTSAQDIVNEIEFELLQGVIRRGEIGSALQQITAFQAESRHLLTEQIEKPQKNNDLATRQAHLNEMTLTLLGEVGQNLVALKEEQTAMWNWLKDRTIPQPETEAINIPRPSAQSLRRQVWTNESIPQPAITGLSEYSIESKTIEQAMGRDALQISVDVHPSGVPIIGGLLNRVRRLLHNLVYFYVSRLAQRQQEINRTYGEHLLVMIQRNAETAQRQKELANLLAALSDSAEEQ